MALAWHWASGADDARANRAAKTSRPSPGPRPSPSPGPRTGEDAAAPAIYEKARITADPSFKQSIAGFKWDEGLFSVEKVPDAKAEPKARKGKAKPFGRFMVVTKGQHVAKGSGWTLALQKKQIVPSKFSDEQGRFTYPLTVEKRDTVVEMFAVGPKGEVERARFVVSLIKKEAPPDPSVEKRFTSGAALGTSWMSYFETQHAQFSQVSLAGKVAASFAVTPGRVFVGGNFFGTLVPIARTGGSKPGFLIGGNLRLGYRVPFVRFPWRLSAHFGPYITNMVGSGFGFLGMVGPHLIVNVQRVSASLSSHEVYGKVSMVLGGAGGIGFKNRELAFGYAYSFSGGRWNLGGDLSALHLEIQGKKTIFVISSLLVDAFVGYSF